MVTGLSPGIEGSQGYELKVMNEEQRDKRCELLKIDKRRQHASDPTGEVLPVYCVRRFNLLLKQLKEFEGSTTAFKRQLDDYLKTIIDHLYLSIIHLHC